MLTDGFRDTRRQILKLDGHTCIETLAGTGKQEQKQTGSSGYSHAILVSPEGAHSLVNHCQNAESHRRMSGAPAKTEATANPRSRKQPIREKVLVTF